MLGFFSVFHYLQINLSPTLELWCFWGAGYRSLFFHGFSDDYVFGYELWFLHLYLGFLCVFQPEIHAWLFPRSLGMLQSVHTFSCLVRIFLTLCVLLLPSLFCLYFACQVITYLSPITSYWSFIFSSCPLSSPFPIYTIVNKPFLYFIFKLLPTCPHISRYIIVFELQFQNCSCFHFHFWFL